mgnify:CR=1 FL=1
MLQFLLFYHATRDGKTIQFSVEDVRPMGRTATGVRGILLERDDVVVSAEVVEEDSPLSYTYYKPCFRSKFHKF